MCILLSSCSLLKKQDTDVKLMVPVSSSTTIYDEQTDYKFIYEKTVKREDGGREELELEGDRILQIQAYSKDDKLVADFRNNEAGLLESMVLYDENGDLIIKIKIKYKEITPEDQ